MITESVTRSGGPAPSSHQELKEGLYARFAVTCGCGWSAGPDTLHISCDDDGLARSREGAARVWLDCHVRTDIAGLPGMWTAGQVADFRQDQQQRIAAIDQPSEAQ